MNRRILGILIPASSIIAPLYNGFLDATDASFGDVGLTFLALDQALVEWADTDRMPSVLCTFHVRIRSVPFPIEKAHETGRKRLNELSVFCPPWSWQELDIKWTQIGQNRACFRTKMSIILSVTDTKRPESCPFHVRIELASTATVQGSKKPISALTKLLPKWFTHFSGKPKSALTTLVPNFPPNPQLLSKFLRIYLGSLPKLSPYTFTYNIIKYFFSNY